MHYIIYTKITAGGIWYISNGVAATNLRLISVIKPEQRKHMSGRKSPLGNRGNITPWHVDVLNNRARKFMLRMYGTKGSGVDVEAILNYYKE